MFRHHNLSKFLRRNPSGHEKLPLGLCFLSKTTWDAHILAQNRSARKDFRVYTRVDVRDAGQTQNPTTVTWTENPAKAGKIVI